VIPRCELGICLAAGFVFAARGWVVGVIDEDVVVARGADHAIDGFAEYLVPCAGGVLFARLFPAYWH
jgi:hypothetical protein